MRKIIFISAAFVCLGGVAAQADTTVTITSNGTSCKVDPPAEVTAPATPSAPGGVAAMRNKNFALARANFQPLAEKGDPDGERLLGDLLMQDCTGIQDKDQGATWIGKAADAGNVEAEAQLGNAYMNGNGVAQDDDKAFALVSKAAAAGNMGAETNLGYLYLSGRGVTQDAYQGIVWTVKAGEQGAPAALLNIAQAYFNGKALPQDNEQAAYYLSVAIQRSTPAQRNRYAPLLNNISRGMEQKTLLEIAVRARRWSPGKDSLSDVLHDAERKHKG